MSFQWTGEDFRKMCSHTGGVYSDAAVWGFGVVYSTDWLVGTFCKENNEPLKQGIIVGNPIKQYVHINVREMCGVLAVVQ